MLSKTNLENLLKSHWTEFIDYKELINNVKNEIYKKSLTIIKQDYVPAIQLKLSVSKFDFIEEGIDVWIDYTVPKDDGVVVGTIIYKIDYNLNLTIKDLYGTHIKPLPKS